MVSLKLISAQNKKFIITSGNKKGQGQKMIKLNWSHPCVELDEYLSQCPCVEHKVWLMKELR